MIGWELNEVLHFGFPRMVFQYFRIRFFSPLTQGLNLVTSTVELRNDCSLVFLMMSFDPVSPKTNTMIYVRDPWWGFLIAETLYNYLHNSNQILICSMQKTYLLKVWFGVSGPNKSLTSLVDWCCYYNYYTVSTS